ncbi:MAG: caspase family protein [Candidatus Latescibacterota bacterium]|jgi:hypothetical protein
MRILIGLCLFLAAALPATAVKRALLIGANEYASPEIPDLKGCVNDVTMTREMLVSRLGFTPANITTLVDGQATAAGIKAAVQEWLIAGSSPGDTVWFHFSGHGSQAQDLNGDEEDGKDELICPSSMNPGDLATVITDDELESLFAQIPAQDVTIVLDACHSGTGTRDLNLGQPRFAQFERAGASSARATKAPSPGSGRSPTPAAQPQAAPSSPSESGIAPGGKLQVLIAGCRAEQTSADARVSDSLYAGVLTYNLVRNLSSGPRDLTYRQLVERTARDIEAAHYIQVPQVEGAADRAITAAPPAAPSTAPSAEPLSGALVFITAVDGRLATLSGGENLRLVPGSILAVFGPEETAFRGAGIAQLRVQRVGPASARGVLLDTARVVPGCRAREILRAQDPDWLCLLVECSDPAVAAAVERNLTACPYVRLATAGGRYDQRLRVTPVPNGLSVTLVFDGTPGTPVVAAGAAELVQALEPQLEQAYTLKALAALDNPCPAFEVEVWANRAGAGTAAAALLDSLPDQKLVQARVGDLLRFNFRVERDCYLTLINVGTSGRITVLFPNQYQPDGLVRPGRVYRTGTPGQMPFQIRAKGPVGRELVKVVATLAPLDLASLRLGQAAGAGTRSISQGSSFVAQLSRDLSGLDAPGLPLRDLAVEAASRGELLLPTEGWATDYLIVETRE